MTHIFVAIVLTLLFYLSASVFLALQCKHRYRNCQIQKNIGKKRELWKADYIFLWVFNTCVTGFMLGLVWLLYNSGLGLYRIGDFELATPLLLVAQVLWVLFWLDTNFYCLHRLVHGNKILLSLVHKEHHKAVYPVVWDSQYLGPVDHFFTIALPLFTVVLLPVPVSVEAFLIALFSSQFTNIAGHCGHELSHTWFAPFSFNGLVARIDPQRKWIARLFNVTCHHDLHHKSPRVNYSLYFTVWDLICGTSSHESGRRIIDDSLGMSVERSEPL